MRVLNLMTASILLPAIALTAMSASQGQERGGSRSGGGVKAGTKTVAAKSAAAISYRDEIEPFFKANCSTCHSDNSHSSGFNVESAEALFKGGNKFGAKDIVSGKAKESKLIAYLRGQQQPRMPMNGTPIAEADIKKIELWIDQGAKIDPIKLGWPYTPPQAVAVPKVKNSAWCKTPIDNFVLAKLEAKGLKPAPPASRVALLRRVYADLIGEPPTPEEAAAFLKDASPQAYPNLVDKLLADPRYGERWGRHWLDLVRYADTHGYENDGARPLAWRYRDYVIRAFNSDKPYDRFLKEQIAGDELYPTDSDAVIATGYLRLSPWDELSTDHEQRWQDYLNDATDTTGSVMLGLTVGCARCHNHKYDRITQADYYRMQAFFVQTKWTETRLPNADIDPPALRRKVTEAETHLKPLLQERDTLRAKHREMVIAAKQQKAKAGEKVTADDREIEESINATDKRRFEELNNQIRHWEDQKRPFEPVAETISDDGSNVPVQHLLLRGNLHTPGPEVKPGFVAALTGEDEKPATVLPPAGNKSTGRRSALANWIGNSKNPMTARVMVNRVWQHHFGRGIVGTPSDFGKNGDKATHPELLDWLALQFEKDGWSIKKLHRTMLLSNTYQESTQSNLQAVKLDPQNKLLWRMNRIRLEGEALRDSILSVSGRLNPEMGGPGVYPRVSDEVLSTGSTHKWGNSSEADGLRRTIYVFQRRSLMLPIVEAFDGPDMNNTCPRRSATTIAPQALALFNGDFSRGEAGYFAQRVIKDAGEDPARQIDRAYEIALIRTPTASQKALALEFLQQQTQRHLQDGQPTHKTVTTALHTGDGSAADPAQLTKARHAALADFCHVLINTNEFIYLD